MLTVLLVIVATLTLVVVATRWYGSSRWGARTKALRSELVAARVPIAARAVDFAELEGLPAPVQRFFRAVLTEGHPLITAVDLRHTGTFNMSETAEQWRAFTSDQQVVVKRPGFDWDGRIAMLPGLPVHVHDAYVAGEGVLHASLLGVVALADLRGKGDIARGELMRFLAEATWYPTALLPSQGVRWTGLDDRSAVASLTDGAVSVALRFTFHPDGPVDTVFAEARARMVGGALVPTPWQGRFWNYEDRGGARVPIDGEVAWLLPAGPKPYWRGHMTDIAFEVAP
jgi:hypothetical protein